VIGIFPEGGIRAGDNSIINGAPMKPGLAALSLHSGAPVIPCVLIGSDRLYKLSAWLHRPVIVLVIGRAIAPPVITSRDEEARERFARDIARAFTSLREEAVARLSLLPEDLPQTPQARKGTEA
jgi:1-acyl-sn-glycerol-3-phosphate acyltransferase